MCLSKYILKIVSVVLIHAFLVSGVSFAADPRDSALAPPLATKSPCQIVHNSDGSLDVITNNDAVAAYLPGEWAFVDLSFMIGQMLRLTKENKLQWPAEILKPLIKKHIQNRDGIAQVLLEGYDIDGIEEVYKDGEVTGFSLPVTRNGAPAYRLIYNLQGGETAIPMKDGTTVYVKVDKDIKDILQELSYMKHDVNNALFGFKCGAGFLQKRNYATPRLQELLDVGNEISNVLEEMYVLKEEPDSLEEFTAKLKAITKRSQACFAYPKLQAIFEEVYQRFSDKDRTPELKAVFINLMVSELLYIKNILSDWSPDFREPPKSVNLNALINSVRSLKANIMKIAVIEYTAGDIEIVTDEAGLTRALANIVINASDAICENKSKGGFKIRTQLTDDKKSVEIILSDTAGGIPVEALPHIFERGFTTKRFSRGLGLAIAKEYIEKRCGGTISVESELGKGTTFVIRLPATDSSIVPPSPRLRRAGISQSSFVDEKKTANYSEDIIHDMGNLVARTQDMADAIAVKAGDATSGLARSISIQTFAVWDPIKGAINDRHRSAQYPAKARDAAAILTPLLSEDAVTHFAEEFIRYYPERRLEDAADDCRGLRLILADCFGLKLDNTYGLGRLFNIAIIAHSAKSIRESANIVTDKNIADDVVIPKECEPALFRVLFNLVGNAQKAMVGKVPKDKRRISLSASRESASVRISVADTGIGLTPEQVISFNTGKSVTRSDGSSIGRGLDICLSNIAKLNGTIEVDSLTEETTGQLNDAQKSRRLAEGKRITPGTTFVIRLPTAEQQNVSDTADRIMDTWHNLGTGIAYLRSSIEAVKEKSSNPALLTVCVRADSIIQAMKDSKHDITKALTENGKPELAHCVELFTASAKGFLRLYGSGDLVFLRNEIGKMHERNGRPPEEILKSAEFYDRACKQVECRLTDFVIPDTKTAPVNIMEVLDVAIQGELPEAMQEDLQKHFATGIPEIAGFRGKLYDLFGCLFINAADATGRRGSVVVDASVEADHLIVRISDNGPGMPKEKVDAFNAPEITDIASSAHEGTGRGLNIAKKIAKLHDGTIEVDSLTEETAGQLTDAQRSRRLAEGKRITPGTTFTLRLPVVNNPSSGLPSVAIRLPIIEKGVKGPDKGKNTTASVVTPESEQIHRDRLADMIKYIQAQPQARPLIVALGTSWIKGYARNEDGMTFKYPQGKDLNELITSTRNYCESKGIPFIDDDDTNLLDRIKTQRARPGMAGAKVVVLADKDTVTGGDFATLRSDEKNSFVVGINSQELTDDSYIRLMEMLTIALRLSIGLDVPQSSTPIIIKKDDQYNIYIFTEPAEPMDYERQKLIYESQKFA